MTPAQLLDFEHQHPTPTPEKHATIRHEHGISEIRYYVLLERAANSIDGIQHDPITARMVRERIENRAARRMRRTAA